MRMDINFTQRDILERGVEEIIEITSLRKKLKSGRKLRVKLGIDPNAPDIHLGHTAPLWKLRQFQELGHKAVLIIGDYTASIGDPSGKDETRPSLTEAQIKGNYKTYEKQALKILDNKTLEVRYQTEWYKNFNLKDVLNLLRKASVGRLLQHETFRERLKKKQQFAVHEIIYPFLQGYDSVAVKADVELGATEQKFNLLMGRELQKAYGQEQQDIITNPYLLGTDGKEKMSKSLGNYIAIQDKPTEMFGKVMSIRDSEIVQYFELVTPVPFKKVQEIKKLKITGKTARDLKVQLAGVITELYWGKEEAEKAQERFETQFQKRGVSKGLSVVRVSGSDSTIITILVDAGFVSSKNEARRLVEQGAVYFDNERMAEYNDPIPKRSFILKAGRKMAKIVPK